MLNKVVLLYFRPRVVISSRRKAVQPFGTISLLQAKVVRFFSSDFHPLMTRLCLGDYNTRHAGKTWARFFSDSTVLGWCLACPVLIGNKWVANKWIHERGQEFRRPCSLDSMAWQGALTFLTVSSTWATISFIVCFCFQSADVSFRRENRKSRCTSEINNGRW